MNELPLEFTWIDNPIQNIKILVGSLTISTRQAITHDLIANCSTAKLPQLEREIKLKIEDNIKDEMLRLLGGEEVRVLLEALEYIASNTKPGSIPAWQVAVETLAKYRGTVEK